MLKVKLVDMLKAEIIVKGVKYPVQWSCHQKTNTDGSLTLKPTRG
jgi:hypothetical protein